MQPPPSSVMLSADAYRRELLADAARVRPVPRSGAAGRGGPTPPSRLRRTIGLALVWSGERVLGGDAVATVRDAAAVSAGRDPADAKRGYRPGPVGLTRPAGVCGGSLAPARG